MFVPKIPKIYSGTFKFGLKWVRPLTKLILNPMLIIDISS